MYMYVALVLVVARSRSFDSIRFDSIRSIAIDPRHRPLFETPWTFFLSIVSSSVVDRWTFSTSSRACV